MSGLVSCGTSWMWHVALWHVACGTAIETFLRCDCKTLLQWNTLGTYIELMLMHIQNWHRLMIQQTLCAPPRPWRFWLIWWFWRLLWFWPFWWFWWFYGIWLFLWTCWIWGFCRFWWIWKRRTFKSYKLDSTPVVDTTQQGYTIDRPSRHHTEVRSQVRLGTASSSSSCRKDSSWWWSSPRWTLEQIPPQECLADPCASDRRSICYSLILLVCTKQHQQPHCKHHTCLSASWCNNIY